MSEKFVALRDKRLFGGVPARPNLSIHNLDAETPVRLAFNGIRADARARKIHTLFILCHGYAGINRRFGQSMDAGGMGLKLGREGLNHSNVEAWRAIRGKADNIVIYACAAADRQPGNELTVADGRYLMGALALYTAADVYAADSIQWYDTYKDRPNGAYDFRAWEGQLLKFPALDGKGVPVGKAPVELNDVLQVRPHD
jgi:hypothetical protein